jgi:cytochrome c-type biogenesis protein CcmH/NrfG
VPCRTSPDLPETYYALALFQYQGRGDLRQGQRYFEQALELQPNHVRALFGLASSFGARAGWRRRS